MYKAIIISAFVALMASCTSDFNNEKYVVGEDYIENMDGVILVDTLTVEVSTVSLDSLITSSQERILVGNYTDPIFGKLKSESYFELTANNYRLKTSTSDTDYTNFVYDSIAVILRHDNYYYGDTLQNQILSVHRLSEKVLYDDEATSFYNTSTLDYESGSLGTITYKPEPNRKDSIYIPISDAYGQELFQKLKTQEISTKDEFINKFNGLMIKSIGENSSSVIGFSASKSSVLRLYYSDNEETNEESLYKDFYISDPARQFNSVSLDRNGTIIQNLQSGSSFQPSGLTGNQSFIQAGSGIVCRLDFPSIKRLYDLSENGTIVDAQLLLRPVKNSNSNVYPLKDSLSVYVADQYNRISNVLYDYNGTQAYALLNQEIDEFHENIGYSISIAGFLNTELTKQSNTRSTLLFSLPSASKSVDRLVIGDQNNSENKIKLKIYYLSY